VACYHPLKAWKTTGKTARGKAEIVFNQPNGFALPVELACGQCIGCRIDKSQQWATRINHEAQFHAHKCFLTLTYSPQNLPAGASLVPRDLTLFLKRLRKAHSATRMRYFACGEYGDTTARPHYHVILFGYDFPDKREHSKTGQGHQQFTSEELDKLWGLGQCIIGSVNWSSAAYVARYVIKKINGEKANEHYKSINQQTGEIFDREHEFIRMSRRPGIGAEFSQNFASDLYPSDFTVVQGKRKKIPAYYDKQLEKSNPDLHAVIKSSRSAQAKKRSADNTPERRAVREEVQKSRLSQLKRNI